MVAGFGDRGGCQLPLPKVNFGISTRGGGNGFIKVQMKVCTENITMLTRFQFAFTPFVAVITTPNGVCLFRQPYEA